MPKKPIILQTKTLVESRLFAIEEVHLRFANGNERFFERLRGRMGGAVMVVPMLDDDTVILIREYGVGIEDYVLTLPKGLLEPDEDIFVAANRELMEETGYGANKMSLIKPLSTAPGYIKGKGMGIVLAEDLFEKKLLGDEPEEIEIVPWRLSQLSELLKRDECNEARTIAALFMIREHFHGR